MRTLADEVRDIIATSPLLEEGLALGIIGREQNGRYVAPRGNNRTIRLSKHKERSAALMGMDASTCT